MRNYILIIILAIFCLGISSPHHRIIARKRVAKTCQEKFAFSTGLTSWTGVAKAAASTYSGVFYITDGDQDVCEVDVYVHSLGGTLDANDEFYMRIYTLDGEDALDTLLGTSDMIEGGSFAATTWISATALPFR